METRWKQSYQPNFAVSALRGWCLKFIDDAGSAPSRVGTAQIALNNERSAGRLNANQSFPVGVWVVAFWSLNSGPYRGLGHVAFVKNYGNRVEIRDSETQTNARSVYTSISQVNSWFGNHGAVYQGWSTMCDGRRYAESYQVPVTPVNSRVAKKGTAKVTVDVLHVRNAPNTNSPISAAYSMGQTFNYDSYQIANGYVWLSYISNSGVRRYVAEGPYDGTPTVWVSGGVG